MKMNEDDSSVEMVFEECADSGKIKYEGHEMEEVVEEEIVENGVKNADTLIEEDDEENVDDCQYHDPMDLLELLETRPSEENLESQYNISPDEISKIQRKMARHNWTFLDDDNKGYIYCLYCDCSLKATASKGLVKHEKSFSHSDRTTEYLNFLNSRHDDVKRIKSNVDYSGDSRDVKAERQALDEDFKTYIWELWTEKHDWLSRCHEEGVIGYCKYCRNNVNAGNSYLRRQHEEGAKHKENQRRGPKRRATVCGEMLGVVSGDHASNQERFSLGDIDKDTDELEKINSKWYESSKSSSDLCRCKLCDITMFIASYQKHTLSNLHKQNITAIGTPGVSDKLEKPDWIGIQKEHPWVIEDPEDPMEAFCKYCKKQVTYGASAAKRLIHEHSSSHRIAMRNFEKENNNNESNNESGHGNGHENLEEHGRDDEEKENVECGDSEGGDVSQNSEEQAKLKDIIEVLKSKYSWAKSYKKDPRFIVCQYCKVILRTRNFNPRKHEICQRHREAENQYLEKLGFKTSNSNDSAEIVPLKKVSYPWVVKLKSSNYVFCKYCRFRLSAKANRSYHQKTARHQEAEKAHMDKIAADKRLLSNDSEASCSDSKIFSVKRALSPRETALGTRTHKKRVKLSNKELLNYFDWVRFDEGMPLNYGYCIFCEKFLFLPSPRYASKHEHTTNHIRARISTRRKYAGGTRIEPLNNSDETSNSSTKSTSEPSAKRLKPSSLHTAIETAKRLTQAHLDMLSFMRKFASEKSHSTLKSPRNKITAASILECPTPRTLLPPQSPIDSNSALYPSNRDPFDLFFTSMSESVKRLPADLASEGKLKVMQIIFDLEMRAQQRQNQTESPNNSINSSIAKSTTMDNFLNETNGLESESNDDIQQNTNKTYSTKQNNLSSKKKFAVNLQSNVMKSHYMPQMQSSLSMVQIERENVSEGFNVARPKVSLPITLNNFNRRVTVNNNTSMIIGSTTGCQSKNISPQSHLDNSQLANGSSNCTNIEPLIRPVPISSLTIQNMPDSKRIKHIQLNSSTQSRIIPLDSSKFKNTL